MVKGLQIEDHNLVSNGLNVYGEGSKTRVWANTIDFVDGSMTREQRESVFKVIDRMQEKDCDYLLLVMSRRPKALRRFIESWTNGKPNWDRLWLGEVGAEYDSFSCYNIQPKPLTLARLPSLLSRIGGPLQKHAKWVSFNGEYGWIEGVGRTSGKLLIAKGKRSVQAKITQSEGEPFQKGWLYSKRTLEIRSKSASNRARGWPEFPFALAPHGFLDEIKYRAFDSGNYWLSDRVVHPPTMCLYSRIPKDRRFHLNAPGN